RIPERHRTGLPTTPPRTPLPPPAMPRPPRLLSVGLGICGLSLAFLVSDRLAARDGAPAAESAAFFQQKVRPILEQNCFQCHSHAAKKSKGGLMLDARESVLKGGDSGPAVVPGKPDESLLLKAVHQTDPDLKMPPKGKLTHAQIA